ncbi:hypothetical protein D3C85_1480660 [compost metagenome]
MAIRPRAKNQRWLVELEVASIGQPEAQFARLKQMQMTTGLIAIEARGAAEAPAVESTGTDAEMREQGG